MTKTKTFEGELHNWGIVTHFYTKRETFDEIFNMRIVGTVYGLERNNKEVITSGILKRVDDFVETENSVYLLIGKCKNLDTLSDEAKEYWEKLDELNR